MGPKTGVIPESARGGVVVATASCVAIGTLSPLDGDTTVSMERRADISSGFLEARVQVFYGRILAASGVLAVCDVYGNELLTSQVPSGDVLVSVHVSDEQEPDSVIIVVEA